MELWREKAAFEAFIRGFGGQAEVYRRTWQRVGDRDAEAAEKKGSWESLLTGWEQTDSADSPAAKNHSTARLYLPPEADIAPGDRVEVTQGGAVESFYAAGQPERYPVYQVVKLRKEEIL